MAGGKDDSVDPYVRQALDDLRERSIRSEEQLKTVFAEMRSGFAAVTQRQEEIELTARTSLNLATATDGRVDVIEKAKASAWDKLWQVAIGVGLIIASVWAGAHWGA